MPEIEKGLCHCGCGAATAPSPRNYHWKGVRKGEPQLYIYGHGSRARWGLDFSSDKARFEEYLYPDPNSGCHLFCGKEGVKGYGIFKFIADKTKTTQAHRAAWILAGKEIPEGMHVLHKCDTPCCCNIDHLYVGTNQQNRRDMAMRNRGAKGKLPFGVALTPSGKWRAQFTAPNNGGNRQLGLYSSMEQAASIAAFVKAVAYGLRGMM